jgi:hypothetical protein
MSEQTERPMQCDCGSTAISTQMDVGFDIDPEGEENQHLDTCTACGKTRLWVYRWDFLTDEGRKTYWGKWRDNKYGFPA